MALVIGDRVLETSTTSGSGSISLAGASPGYQSFSTGVGNGNQTYYTIYLEGGTEWEVGIGTYTSVGDTLSRDTVLASSASGAKVGFSAGNKQVFVTYPAEKAVYGNQSGNISASSNKIINVATPTDAGDATNKQYVDDLVAAGVTYHTPVKYEVPDTTGNLNATYNQPGGPGDGVGATLTNAGTLAAFVPDGVTASISDRILIYNQTNAYENGVYTVTTVGNGSTAWVLTRSTDTDSYALKSPTGLGEGDAFFVSSGNTGAGETYVCNTNGTITFGTTAITFVQISATQIYAAGNGIVITGPTISLDVPVTVPNGGTGLTTAPTNGQLLTGNGTGYSLNTLQAGTGISVANTPGSITITNSAPDQTVSISSGTGISATGTYPNFTVTNTLPDQTVVLTGAGATSISGTYPSFTISSTNSGGTVTSVDVSGGTTGLTTSGGPITSSGTITLAGTLAVANGGTGQTTYTNGQLLIGNTTGNTLTKATLTAGSGITITNGAGSITIASTGGSSAPVAETDITITTSYTISSGKNALSVAPVTIGSGGVLNVPTGQTYMVLNSSAGSGGGQIATVGKAIAMTLVFGG